MTENKINSPAHDSSSTNHAPSNYRQGGDNSTGPRSRHESSDRQDRPRRGNFERRPKPVSEYNEKMLHVRRVTQVTTGGRRMRLSVAVAIGNGKGKVGYGIAKANEIPDAFKKAKNDALKNVFFVEITKDQTIPHEVNVKFGASRILLKPAKPGSGIKAGGPARDILELAGIKNVIAKSLGSRNKINIALATITALKALKPKAYYSQLKTGKELAPKPKVLNEGREG